MRCGKDYDSMKDAEKDGSQPARMRCGKVAYSGGKDSDCISRNPRECAVAKIAQYRQHTQ